MIAKTRHIDDTKNLLGEIPTIRYVDAPYIYIATDNARCPNAELFINPGDYVKVYQVIGVRHAQFFDQPIHATCSGTFEGLEEHYHRSGKKVKFIKIKNDFKDEADKTYITSRTDEEIAKLSRQDMMQILKDTANCGLGGSSFPTYIKFNTDLPIDTILINGIECEPYLNADNRIMWEYPYKIIEGIKYAMQAFNAKRAIICVKSTKKRLIEVYSKILSYRAPNISIKGIGNYFPLGWEINMIKEATGIKVKTGELPSKYGIMNFNVSTMLGIYRAIKHNEPVIARNITVTGDGIRFPQNFRVRIGTPIKDFLDKCGGYKDPDVPKVFILGGPMMGASLPSDDAIITKTVTSVIVLNATEYKEEPCVRCGSCVLSCPTGLEPVQIMNAVKAMDKERVKYLNPTRCIECGLCTYSCTSKIKVLDWVRKAKIIAKL